MICKEVGLENVYEKEVRKEEVEEALFYANQKMIKEEMMRYEKLKSVKDGDFRKEQEYMRLCRINPEKLYQHLEKNLVPYLKPATPLTLVPKCL